MAWEGKSGGIGDGGFRGFGVRVREGPARELDQLVFFRTREVVTAVRLHGHRRPLELQRVDQGLSHHALRQHLLVLVVDFAGSPSLSLSI